MTGVQTCALPISHILVVGDAMLDRYWHGGTRRISAEAPIPVVEVNEIEDRIGGAANVALNISTLGSKASLIAAVGIDEAGRVLKAKLDSAGITSYLIESKDIRTTTKIRMVSQSQQLLRADFEDIADLKGELLLPHLESSIDAVDLILLSDYDKGVLADAQVVIQAAVAKNKGVLVDPKFKPLSVYRGATVVKPNRDRKSVV